MMPLIGLCDSRDGLPWPVLITVSCHNHSIAMVPGWITIRA